jgi:diaminopimelate epimerase
MLKFTKFQGAGNDFILIDDRAGTFPLNPSYIQHLCHRNFGIGADGLILVQQASDGADVRMCYFNRDGIEAQMCGNGVRCFGRFLLELGLTPKNEKIRVSIHGRIVELFYVGERVGVAMGKPKKMTLHVPTERGIVHFVDTGVPHIVHFVDSLKETPLHELGPFWRHHPLFAPHGVNVNLAGLEGGGIRIRTFERGVEGETLACGTGACAVASIAHALYACPGGPPHEGLPLSRQKAVGQSKWQEFMGRGADPISISCLGGEMEVQVGSEGLFMVGPAVKVFNGIFHK